ncbi:MAG: gliding motility-associated C-terminal domain-containing protein [Saprospiraceae bacterium]
MNLFSKFCFFFCCFLGTLTVTNAQINPPDFVCVKGDTLVWETPVNNCGSFNSYEIYFSADFAGPYTLLATITNPATTNFVHNDPSGDVWYYYFVSDFNCPGQTAISSDTLDNLSPLLSPLNFASVDGTFVNLDWEPSPSPEVVAYIIYRTTDIGTVAIDTVFGPTSYTDVNASPNAQSEVYSLTALDACGNTSLFTDFHRTMFMESEVSPCEQTVRLNWNLYEGWSGIQQQEIWLGLNGGMMMPIDTISAADTDYIYENANDGDFYCFYIRAVSEDGTAAAQSNRICQSLDITQPVRNLYLKNVSVIRNDSIELTWSWDTNAEITLSNILRSSNQVDYSSVLSITPEFPLQVENQLADLKANPGNGKTYYVIQTIDECDSIAQSNYIATVFLQGTSLENRSNEIQWTAYDHPFATIVRYDLYKERNGQAFFVESFDPNTRTYTDLLDISLEQEARNQYYVLAIAMLELPDGTQDLITSKSNTVNLQQLTKIITPNAFAPYGKNTFFRPIFVFESQIQKYELVIFDRFGSRVFETQQSDEGWDGRKNGQDLRAGVYVYQIRVTQFNGEVVEKSGTVYMLR